ncbi:hypothetical protein ACFQJD_07440 [Haloplanus sp. GCM10025708]
MSLVVGRGRPTAEETRRPRAGMTETLPRERPASVTPDERHRGYFGID